MGAARKRWKGRPERMWKPGGAQNLPPAIGFEEFRIDQFEETCLIRRTSRLDTLATLRARLPINAPEIWLRVITAGQNQVQTNNGGAVSESETQASLILASKPLTLTVNQLPGMEHQWVMPMYDARKFWATFGKDSPPPRLRALMESRTESLHQSLLISPAALSIAREIHIKNASDLSSRLRLGGLTLLLLAEVLSEWDIDIDGAGSEPRALRIARHMLMERLKNPPSVSELAQLVGLPPRRLASAFRNHYGQTITESINAWRLERGRELLSRKHLAIKWIAFELGYGHSSNFIAAFTRRYGVSPGRFRRS